MLKLEGFGFFVKDMPTMIRFYRDVLGFEIKEEEQSSNVYLIKDGVLFLLYGRNDFEKMTLRHYDYATPIQGHTELALAVENHKAVDEEYKRLMDLGVNRLWSLRPCLGGNVPFMWRILRGISLRLDHLINRR